ncbi:protein OCTOPUS-like [Silene latifolia]|uniref:protein OCTOPUS-like n=1 Tax=Silene latifolia TaxID=37657 RepID=UPI003D76FCF4
MSQNPKPRRLTSCRRHPDIPTTTGLCAPCLHERLSFLAPSTSSSTLSAASAAAPELRRCKTFSGKNRDDVVLAPGRRSCDVGGCAGSLSALFDQEKDDNGSGDEVIGSKNVVMTWPVPEVDDEGDEDEDEDDDESVPEAIVAIPRVSDLGKNEGEINEFEEGKTMKEFIDLELKSTSVSNNRKDFKDIAGSFLGAASVFSKKLRKWRKKQECSSSTRPSNCNGNGDKSLGELRVEDLRGRRLSYTQSEVGDYGFGRRSCDTDTRGGSVVLGRASIDCGAFGRKSCDSDPRFSIDIGRGSADESKSEFVDAPRASWDGYLVGGGGGRALSNRGNGNAPVVSVIENAMATVYGFDDRVLGEGKVRMSNGGDEKDSSVRRRDGFDRCSSVKTDVVVMSEDKGLLSNAKVSPTAAIGLFNGTKLLITEKELNEWRLNSLKDDSSESYETASKDLGSVSSSSVGKDEKKCRQWSKLWNFWGSLNRRKRDKFGDEEEEEEELTRGDGPRPDEMIRNGNKGGLVRSYSTSSSRGSSSVVGSTNGTTTRTDSMSIVKRRLDDGVLERSRSGRYSPTPNNVDNGLLRFYLTPLRSRRRNRLGKSRLKKSHSLARSVLKLY